MARAAPASCPALIDFEASCLPEYGRSFPIEVALARVDGRSKVWLIRPADEWRDWDWSAEAERLHGLDRERLWREGRPIAEVVSDLRAFAADCDVYADADVDEYWLEVLCQAAQSSLPFPVRYLGEFMQERGFTRPQVIAALAEARNRLPEEHQAREDARRLALTVRLLLGGSAAMPA